MAFARGFLDHIKDDVNGRLSDIKNNTVGSFKYSTNKMKEDAKKQLKRASDTAMEAAIKEPVEDVLSQLEMLSDGIMTPMNYAINDINKIGDNVNQAIRETLTLNNAVEAIHDPNSVLGRVQDNFSMNKLLGGVTSFAPSPNNSMHKLYSTEFINDWNGKDPINEMANVGKFVRAIIEDSGYVTDKFRSINFSRNGIFINRPYLEGDTGGFYRSYAFLTRPNLNLVGLNGSMYQAVPELKDYPSMYSQVLTDMELYSELCRDACGKGNLFTLLSNYIKEVPPIRLTETNRDGIKNMFNKGMPMPGIPEIYTEVDIPITFIDNGRGDISKLLYCLSMYKTLVGRDQYPMSPEYIKYKGIDYLMSLYIVTVDADWEIIGFGVALGLMISEPPTHFTQHRMDGFSKPELLEDFTVNFKASTYIPFAPEYFDTFNRLFGFNPGNIVDTRGSGTTLYMSERDQDSYQGAGNSLRSSVFSSTGGYDVSSITINDVNQRVNNIGFNRNAALEGAQIASQYLQNSTSKNEVNTTIINALQPYHDCFEMIGRCPGVYTGSNTAEKNRTVYKLGFSW